ncbi:glycoside hydrolases [Nesidiocoris tenuis]|uniref:Glycoside hydrolases n=1 Tax=Nesidiocoris tenuis TaxID=355587 RepID=A0ABN7AA98_9HEMI|nr:glycoside hydrolases [Nesidiocoris tenuis]
MRAILSLVIVPLVLSGSFATQYRPPPVSHTNFPKGFLFGSATASYQVEGAWNDTDKGESIWDHITHNNPNFIAEQQNGDIADDSFHKFKEDIRIMKDIGFKSYRFSISWPRVLPTGKVADGYSKTGLNYYTELIDELLANGIEPLVTLYHWDLPQALQEERGGWLNPNISDYFADYADFMFSKFAPKVKYWITINEPLSIVNGYGDDARAPALKELHGIGEYVAGHNLLLAHSKAYKLYQDKYSHNLGKISMAFCGSYCAPASDSVEDIEAAERCYQFTFGWFIHPVLKGDYHPLLRSIIDENSQWEGRKTSRLPYFSQQEIDQLKGSADFLGLNYYTMLLAKPGLAGLDPSDQRDSRVVTLWDPSWKPTVASWLRVAPEGLRMLLNKVKNDYGNPEVLITENGYPDDGSDPLNDTERINYYETHFAAIRQAIYEDGCNVVGHTSWSLMDNFEWRDGYKAKFGIFSVDFNSPNRTRTMKKSAYWLKNYIAMHDYL